jgi:hypothetical protein
MVDAVETHHIPGVFRTVALIQMAVDHGGTAARVHDRHRHLRTLSIITEDQTGVIDFLTVPSTHGGATVERSDTHASIVFLAGARAYKLKRGVRFDYLDFSTSERPNHQNRIRARTGSTVGVQPSDQGINRNSISAATAIVASSHT